SWHLVVRRHRFFDHTKLHAHCSLVAQDTVLFDHIFVSQQELFFHRSGDTGQSRLPIHESVPLRHGPGYPQTMRRCRGEIKRRNPGGETYQCREKGAFEFFGHTSVSASMPSKYNMRLYDLVTFDL